MSRNNQAGFTLLELMVVTGVIGILATLVSGFYVDRLVDYARNNTLIILQSNTKQALESVVRDVKESQSIETTNQNQDAHGPGGNKYGWTTTSGSPSTLVLATPTEDINGNLQYVDGTHALLLTNDIVYYVDSTKKTLYRHVVANPICLPAQGGTGTVNCKSRTTCPPTQASPSCPADGTVIEDVANLQAAFYSSTDAVTTDVNNIYSLSVTLTQSRASFGRTYQNSLSSRATLRNKP